MTRITVISDLHHSSKTLRDIIQMRGKGGWYLFCGDGITKFISVADDEGLNYYAVGGNCDIGYDEKERYVVIDDTVIFLCHGHTLGVKGGIGRLVQKCVREGADIVLYGHTHTAYTEYLSEDDTGSKPLYIMNPGSADESRSGYDSFGTIDIIRTSSGKLQVSMNIVEI